MKTLNINEINQVSGGCYQYLVVGMFFSTVSIFEAEPDELVFDLQFIEWEAACDSSSS